MNKWILGLLIVLVIGVVALGITWFIAHADYRRRMAEAEATWTDISDNAPKATQFYDPAMVQDMPEIAQRYFNHAIAVGTPLASVVELEMEGPFLLGNKDKSQQFEMRARQILSAPDKFVWIAHMNAGLMIVSGSDAFVETGGWTRFWMFWALPLVQAASDEGFDRSAALRPAIESIWLPSSLLPHNGVKWEQLGRDVAKITVGEGETQIALTMTLNSDGGIVDIVAPRWSNANPEQVYQFQPFGGSVEAEATFGGFTIPSVVHVGNFYGTDDYFAFFNARITQAKFY